MPLTDLACRAAKPTGKVHKIYDGGGLALWIKSPSSKLWRLSYRFGGKPKTISFGAYPIVSLSDARRRRDEAKSLLAQGQDPMDARRAERLNPSATTFGAIAEEYLVRQGQRERATATLEKLEWLLGMANAALGNKQIAEITIPEVLDALRAVEGRGRYETAKRLRSTISAVFRLAMASGRVGADPTICLRDALVSPPERHRAAITNPKAFGALLRAIDGFEGQKTTTAALRLMALLFPRPGELRLAEWAEFDLDRTIWDIPAQRTKMRRPHRVHLSRQAVVVLADLKTVSGRGRLLFPSLRSSDRPMSENTMNAALRRLGYSKDEATSHGFRASAATLLNESGEWHPDAIERQLAHIDGNSVRRAYARGEHWDERVEMMQWWADYLDKLRLGGLTATTPNKDDCGDLSHHAVEKPVEVDF